MEWSEKNSLLLIELYRVKGVLWDPTTPGYYNKTKKNNAWEDIAAKMGKPVDECRRKMISLLSSFRRERGKMRKKTEEGTGKYFVNFENEIILYEDKIKSDSSYF